MTVYTQEVKKTMTQNSLTYTGDVLVGDYWVSETVDFAIGIGTAVGIVLLTQQMDGFEVTMPLVLWSGNMLKTVLISYAQMSFKNQLIVADNGSTRYKCCYFTECFRNQTTR